MCFAIEKNSLIWQIGWTEATKQHSWKFANSIITLSHLRDWFIFLHTPWVANLTDKSEYVCLFLWVPLSLCVCVCGVWKRERERERERESVCVCVCVRERERERRKYWERVRCEWEHQKEANLRWDRASRIDSQISQNTDYYNSHHSVSPLSLSHTHTHTHTHKHTLSLSHIHTFCCWQCVAPQGGIFFPNLWTT